MAWDTLALAARMADMFAIVALVSVSVSDRPMRRIVVVVFALAIAVPVLRLLLQAATLADGGPFGPMLRLVVIDTHFGAIMLSRIAIAALWFVVRARRTAAIALAALDIAALALLGHGAASSWPLFGALVLGVHIGAASLWLAGMAAALFGIARKRDGVTALRGFAPLGLACVALLVISGLLNLQLITGDILGAFAGDYGAILIAKLVCFAAMLGLAAVNRFALLPRLDHAADRPATAAHPAMLALAAETVLGAVVVGLAALLGSAAPVL
jgi:putative copper resistance protein D